MVKAGKVKRATLNDAVYIFQIEMASSCPLLLRNFKIDIYHEAMEADKKEDEARTITYHYLTSYNKLCTSKQSRVIKGQFQFSSTKETQQSTEVQLYQRPKTSCQKKMIL